MCTFSCAQKKKYFFLNKVGIITLNNVFFLALTVTNNIRFEITETEQKNKIRPFSDFKILIESLDMSGI